MEYLSIFSAFEQHYNIMREIRKTNNNNIININNINRNNLNSEDSSSNSSSNNNCNNYLLWQPWRDFSNNMTLAAAAVAASARFNKNNNESRLTTKELPTTKWRRDRRLRATASDYHQHISSPVGSPNPQSPKPLTESTNTVAGSTASSYECPIDMSVTSTTIKIRNSPPPPYREPLPGSTYATALARPSVITQAPPKRNTLHHNSLISNRENDNSNSESNSTCDPVIDEQSVDDHFAKALGDTWKKLKAADNKNVENLSTKKYPSSVHEQPPTSPTITTAKSALIANSSSVVGPSSSPPPPPPPTPPPAQSSQPPVKTKSKLKSSPTLPVTLPTQHQQRQPKKSSHSSVAVTNNTDSVSHSVDDHFAKALGDTWKKLQADKIARNDED